MTNEQITEHLSELSEEALKSAFKQAESDLAEAAAQQPNSEWHQSCFAGLLIYGGELAKRGIFLGTRH